MDSNKKLQAKASAIYIVIAFAAILLLQELVIDGETVARFAGGTATEASAS